MVYIPDVIPKMMDRRYLKDLIEWKDDPYRKPLIVWGARQVGKTYLVKDIFAERFFSGKYVYIDFKRDVDFRDYCDGHPDPKDVLNYLSLKNEGLRFGKDTLIIFDEVQECPAAITLMKYFCQDYREIPVIETGSMVRMRLKRRRGGSGQNGFMFPVGKINEITVSPMTFDEYLFNRNRALYDTVVDSYSRKTPMDTAFHEMAMGIFYEYMLIGGMPEAVDVFLREEDMQKALRKVREIYNNYLGDMDLYQASPESIVRSRQLFRTIYTQLNKTSKNFKPTLTERG